MILFLEDWVKYPTAVVHVETKNDSFLKMSNILKERGIANHTFMLALHNPLLANVDPHGELDDRTKLMVNIEINENFWYYVREVIRIEQSGSSMAVHMDMNRALLALYFCFFNYVNTFLILIRQKGKSIGHDWLYSYLLNSKMVNSNIFLLTKDSILRSENVERLKGIFALLPDYTKMYTHKDKMNTDIIEVTALNNKMKIGLAQKSILAARNVGRGPTITVHAVDEVNYDYNIKWSLPAMLAAGTTAKKHAMAVGQPAGTLLYSSVGYLDTDSGSFGRGLYDGAMRWTDDLYDVSNRENLQTILEKHVTGAMDLMLIEFNHTELGMSDADLRKAIRGAGVTGVQAEVEFLNKWAKGSSESVLPRKLIKTLMDYEVAPLHMEISDNGFTMSWYVDPELYIGRSFVLGLDLSEMIGEDSGSIKGVDIITGEVLCAGDYNTANINDFGYFIYWLMSRYPKSILIGEKKSVMMAVFDQVVNLMVDQNVFKRFFNWRVHDRLVEEYNASSSIRAYGEHRRHFGYHTTGQGRSSREALFNKLIPSVELTGNKVRDKTLIRQLTKLEKKNGRIDHVSGEHDDAVIAWLLCHWFLKEGKNMEYYGIDPNGILSVVDSGDNANDVNTRVLQERREGVVRSINDLLDDLVVESNGVLQERLKMRIRILNDSLECDQRKTLNVEGRLKQIKEDLGRKH